MSETYFSLSIKMTNETFSAAEHMSGMVDIDPDSGFFLESDSYYYSDISFNQELHNCPLLGRHCSMIFLNIRSAVKNLESFHDYLTTLNFDFTVIGLAETWLTSDTEQLCNLPGYKYFGKRRKVRVGGGVGFLVRNLVTFKPREDLSGVDDFIECSFIEIPYTKADTRINSRALVGVIYRPPGANLGSFLESISTLLTRIKNEGKSCYLMGDFNINLMNHDAHAQTNEFLDLMYSNSFYPLINKPTRITSHSSTLIDNIFHNSFTNDQLAGILYADISDHLPIFVLSKSVEVACKETNSFVHRRVNDRSISAFRCQLRDYNWHDLYNVEDAEAAYNYFLSKFLSIYDSSFPLVIKCKSSKKLKPWISSAIKSSIRMKNKLYKKYHRIPTLYNEITYKSYRRILNRTITAAKKSYYNNALEEHKNNLKRTWQILKEIIGIPGKSEISKTFLINNNEETDATLIANSLNEYFVNVGRTLAADIPPSNQDPTAFIESVRHSIFLVPAVEGEVERCLSQLKEGSAGHDGIKPSIIKKCKEYLTAPLTYIFNLSICEGCVPNSLKYAYVTPVYKSGDKTLMNNYRPISVLPVFSKLLERLIFNRIYSFITEKNILSVYQFGFRKKLSTEMALITAIDKITQAIESKEHTVGLFLDLKKAFDTVDISILLKKLQCYGIRGNALDWFTSYLSNRSQSVKYGQSVSYKLPVTMGVPQGSILGPLLFILYINDMPSLLQNAKPVIFADDTTLFVSARNVESAFGLLKQDVDRLMKWFTVNKLSLNLKKTNYMLFTTNSSIRQSSLQFRINDTLIDRVQSCKFLGVHIDEKLSWSDHVDHVCHKLRKSIGVLRKVSSVLDQSTLRTLYFTMMYPYLTYCHLLWGCTSVTNLTRIHRLQKKAVRIICKQPRLAHTLPLFSETKIIDVNNLYKYLLALFTFKLSHHLLPHSFHSQISIDIFGFNQNQPTRNLNCRLPLCRTTIRQYTIFYQVPKLCNDLLFRLGLPENIPFLTFKKLMKNLFT